MYGDYGLRAMEVNLKVLKGTARKLAELISTTQYIDDISKVFISSSEDSIELKRKEGKTLNLTERQKQYYKEYYDEGRAVIAWKFDNLRLEETP